mgnify:CR=1
MDRELFSRIFQESNLYQSSSKLFKTLGYDSSRRLTNENLFETSISDYFGLPNEINKKLALVNYWEQLYFLFQLTPDDMGENDEILNYQEDTNNYRSYLFFALDLKGNKDSYHKTQLEGISVAFNRLFLIPCFLLIKHGSTISLVIANRRTNKRDPSRDVIQQ